MKLWLHILLAIFFILPDNLYAGAPGSMDNIHKTVNLDVTSNGKEVEMKVGDELRIELEGTGGTGYWWYFDKLDSVLLGLISEETRPVTDEAKTMVGGAVIGIWKLRANKPGHSIIRMKYYRNWEKSDKAIKQFEISVNISP